MKAVDKTKILVEAQEQLKKLQAAKAQASLFQAKESLTAKKRERERLLAALAEKEESLKLGDKSSGAYDPAKKGHDNLNMLSAEVKDIQAAIKKVESDIATEQSRYDKVAAEYQRMKTVSASSAVQQSKL